MRALIVLPSYNESENILALISALLENDPTHRVCVVDDSSPDGTSPLVAKAIEGTPGWTKRVHLITRTKKDGRGGAVRDGFAWGLESADAFEAFVEMDCDFSHEPSAIPRGLELLAQGNDLVIGARYPSGTIIGWPLRRRVFSFLANQLARRLIEPAVADYTNGFRFYSPRAVRALVARPQRHKGYIYLSESLSYLLRDGMSVASFPIRFRNRDRGVSNTSLSEIRSALYGIFSIAREHHRSER
jgi:glycosyltransferase involved in cell wall biosynthesis